MLEPSASETKETEQNGMGDGGWGDFIPPHNLGGQSSHTCRERGRADWGRGETCPPEETPASCTVSGAPM